MKKRWLSLAVAATAAITVLAGCGSKAAETTAAATEAATTEAASSEAEETTAADDTKLSDLPGAVEETETEPGFERVGVLKGETYNLVALDQTITARAFTANRL